MYSNFVFITVWRTRFLIVASLLGQLPRSSRQCCDR